MKEKENVESQNIIRVCTTLMVVTAWAQQIFFHLSQEKKADFKIITRLLYNAKCHTHHSQFKWLHI